MKNLFGAYLNFEKSVTTVVFDISVLAGLIGFGAEFIMDMIFNVQLPLKLIHLACVFGMILLLTFLRQMESKPLLQSFFVILVTVVAVPACLLFQANLVSGIPLYFLLCLVFSTLVTHGTLRRIVVAFSVLWDVVCMYIVIFFLSDEVVIRPTMENYVRIPVAVIICSIFVGLVIRYRNYVLTHEMETTSAERIDASEQDLSKDMFMVNVSHDIRTPLQAIIGTSELLLTQQENDEVKKNAYMISNAGHALLSMTSDLIDFSKLQDKEITVVEEKFHLSILLDDLINMFSVQLQETNVELITTINPWIPEHLEGDREKLKRVLTNVLSNAVKYTASGLIELTVDYEKVDDRTIRIRASVSDTGIGMDEELVRLVNEPYDSEYTKECEQKNIALGLIHCKKLIHAMGGNFTCNSKPGEGSTFLFTMLQKISEEAPIVSVDGADKYHLLVYEKNEDFTRSFENICLYFGIRCTCVSNTEEFIKYVYEPKFSNIFVTREHLDELTREQQERIVPQKLVVINDSYHTASYDLATTFVTRPVNSMNVGAILNGESNFAIRMIMHTGDIVLPNVKVLIVDDNLINLEMASSILKRYECDVVTVSSGRECLNVLRHEPFDIVFLDYMMPEMDGIDTLKAIRTFENHRTKTIPAVALTANAVTGAREMFLEAGFDEYISKPIEIEHLENVLFKLLPKTMIIYRNEYEGKAGETNE